MKRLREQSSATDYNTAERRRARIIRWGAAGAAVLLLAGAGYETLQAVENGNDKHAVNPPSPKPLPDAKQARAFCNPDGSPVSYTYSFEGKQANDLAGENGTKAKDRMVVKAIQEYVEPVQMSDEINNHYGNVDVEVAYDPSGNTTYATTKAEADKLAGEIEKTLRAEFHVVNSVVGSYEGQSGHAQFDFTPVDCTPVQK